MKLLRIAVILLLATGLPLHRGWPAIGMGVVVAPSAAQSVLLTALTLVNNGGGTAASGTTSPMFGLSFAKGAITSGTAPIFKLTSGGTVQSYSWGGQTNWSDGSLKFASFILRTTSSISASGTLSIDVWSGGTAPVPSARTLTEVYAQNIVVGATSANATMGSAANLATGTWSGYLKNDANNWQQLVYLDGDAGRVWKISTHMATSAGGTAHGQLEVNHYIAALTDASGNLGGFQELPEITQPWYNADTVIGAPVPNIRAFTATSFQITGPATITLSLPWSAQTFTVTGGQASTATANNYYSGVQGGVNLVPVFVSNSGGALPTGLSANTIYWAGTGGPPGGYNSQQFNFYTQSNGGGLVTISGGSGTNTVTPLLTVSSFDKLRLATATGRWNEFQGTGSGNTGTMAGLNWQFSKTYMVSTKVLLPYRTSLTVADTTYNTAWNPYNIGTIKQDFSAESGEQQYLAMMPHDGAITHLYNQSVASEQLVRIEALSTGHFCYNFRDYTSKNLANMSNTTYSGMPASGATSLVFGANSGDWAGFTTPPPSTVPVVMQTNASDHRPGFPFYAYLITGEPQYLDDLMEMANGSMLPLYFHITWRNPSYPYQAYGIAAAMGDTQMRTIAWALRDIHFGAGLAPATMPDGSAFNTYIMAQSAANSKWLSDIMDPAQDAWSDTNANPYPRTPGAATTFATTAGLFTPVLAQDASGAITANNVMFEFCYIMWAELYASTANEDAKALSWLKLGPATYFNWILSNFGGWAIPAYYVRDAGSAATNSFKWPPITQTSQYGYVLGGYGTNLFALSWAPGTTTAFTMSAVTTTSTGYTPSNGDRITFMNGGSNVPTLPAGLSYWTEYYIVNLTGPSGGNYNLGLATSPGGSAITITNSGTGNNYNSISFAALSANTPASSTGFIETSTPPYAYNVRGSINAMIAAGITSPSLTTVQSDIATRISIAEGLDPADWKTEPAWDFDVHY